MTKKLTPSFQTPITSKEKTRKKGEMEIGIINNEVNHIESTTKISSTVVLDDHSYRWQKDNPKYLAFLDQRNLPNINGLILENKLLKRKTLCYANSNRFCFTWRKIKTDATMNFHTGIKTIEMFNVIITLIEIDSTSKL